MHHGQVVTLGEVQGARTTVRNALEQSGVLTLLASPPDLKRFDFLFPDLQGQEGNLLPTSQQTVENLRRLGATMHDAQQQPALDSGIPAAYTYLGQFIDHDITLEAVTEKVALNDPALAPLGLEDIRERFRNTRSATLDLDSVYDFPAPRDDQNAARMKVGPVTSLNASSPPFMRPTGKDDQNDLPREGASSDPSHDRAALTGDPRNDENLIVAQLHVAFLRAHNALVDGGRSFDEARALLRQHYQWVVVHDFLARRITGPSVVQDILDNGNRVFRPQLGPFFMPLEFAVAAYRFGHTMVRATYDHNVNFPAATLEQLFTFTALQGQISPSPGTGGTQFPTLPDNWIIEWDRFVDGPGLQNFARALDTRLVEPLFTLHDLVGDPLPDEARLAVRNLLRGYLLRMPTGQAVARAMGLSPLAPEDLLQVASQVQPPAGGERQEDVLRESGFHERTPLWFYILAEAAHSGTGHLGPVGGRLIAEVLIEMVRRSEDSILRAPGWQPTLPSAGAQFDLGDLLRLGNVL
jgi:hypothetical protein